MLRSNISFSLFLSRCAWRKRYETRQSETSNHALIVLPSSSSQSTLKTSSRLKVLDALRDTPHYYVYNIVNTRGWLVLSKAVEGGSLDRRLFQNPSENLVQSYPHSCGEKILKSFRHRVTRYAFVK